MYLLYLDESGNPENPEDRHFVLAGAAIFERVTFFLSGAIDAIQARHFPGVEPIPFHATDIASGKGFWRQVPKETRFALLGDVGRAIAEAMHPGLFLFGAVIDKDRDLHGEAAVRRATEEICRRFDVLLKREYQEYGNAQRGLIVFAESRYQTRHRVWVQDFRRLGTQWGLINNLSDIPYFAIPRETRLLQVADMVAHATWVLYERHDARLIRPFIQRFDRRAGVLHGISHVTPNRAACPCPRCCSEREPHSLGPWFDAPPTPPAAPAPPTPAAPAA